MKRDHSKLVEAIIAGVPADQVKDKMVELDARRKALELQLASMDHPAPVMFHPGIAAYHREQVAPLIKGQNEAEQMETAKETLRALVDKIVLAPEAESTGLSIDVHGALGSLLRLALGLPVGVEGAQMQKAPRVAGREGSNSWHSADADLEAIDIYGESVLVAGARNRRHLPKLSCYT